MTEPIITPGQEDEGAEGATKNQETSPDSTQDDSTAQPKKKTAEDRIAELTRKRREAERDADYWRGVAQRPASPPAPEPTKPAIKKADDLDPDDFDTPAEYQKAYGKALRAEIRAEEESKRQERETADAASRTLALYAKAREKYEDFDSVALRGSNPITQDMFSAAMGENLGDVLYYLGSNVDEAARISTLSPLEQVKEIGKIEDKLKTTQKKPKPTSETPNPPDTKIKGGGASEVNTDQTKMSRNERFAQWEKDRVARARMKMGLK